MHIVLASDNNYAEFVAVVIVSAIANNHDYIHFHLLANDIDSATIRLLRAQIPAESGELHEYNICDLKERLQVKVPETIAVSSYARLFLPSILPTDIKKIIYVDCDTVIADDISGLWNTELQDNYIAGVLDTLPNNESKTNIGLPATAPYINAGVLLINLELWRQNQLEQKFIQFLLNHDGHVHHHDQGIINGVCKGKVKIVHPRYNCTSNYYSHPFWLLQKTNTPFYTEKEYMQARNSPAILHFTEGFYNRPWIANSLHPKRSVFHHYHDLTAWKDEPLRKDRRSRLVRMLSWVFLNLPYPVYDFSASAVSKLSELIKRK